MKLLYCPECGDVRKLSYDKTFCDCGKSWGYYEKDGLNAVIGGITIPVGINNFSFQSAITNQPENGLGSKFEAFVIPRNAPTVRKEG